jgi:MoxR-like ATPase
MIQTEIEALGEKIYESSAFITRLTDATANVIVGQENMIDRLLVGLLTKGHILLEGLLQITKTLAIKTFTNLVNGKFSRIQFTPDLLPADIVGTMIYNPAQNQFSVKKGRFLPISFSPMKSTEHRLRFKVLFLKQCKKNK